jgi:hypothetical protein
LLLGFLLADFPGSVIVPDAVYRRLIFSIFEG